MKGENIVIAVDGMGGDNAPYSAIRACQFISQNDDVSLIISGDEALLNKKGFSAEKYPFARVCHCEKFIGMHDKVTRKMLKEKDNSMAKTLSLLKEGASHCALSAGNTSAFVACAISELGLINGVERPSIAILLPNMQGSFTILLDAGANTNTKPSHLLQSAIMGTCYAETVFGMDEPRVALLNIGSEKTKGDDLRKSAFELISKSGDVNFSGNIEGQDLFTGKADIVLTDGFTGNVVLKVTEGITRSFRTMLQRELRKNLVSRITALLLKSSFRNFARKGDYAEYGGGILLGVNGVVVISHGRSSPRAIYSAIKLGRNAVVSGFMQKLEARFAEMSNG